MSLFSRAAAGQPGAHTTRRKCWKSQHLRRLVSLDRAYLQRLLPAVREMRASIDAEADGFPDLLARSADILRAVLGEALGELPAWALSSPAACRILPSRAVSPTSSALICAPSSRRWASLSARIAAGGKNCSPAPPVDLIALRHEIPARSRGIAVSPSFRPDR